MHLLNSICIAIMLFIVSQSVLADGQLMVMPARTEINDMGSKKIRLSNLGDKPLYLKLSLEQIENPGFRPERKKNIGDILNPELILNSSKITLGPGQRKDISITPLMKPKKETVYRLYIIPVSSIKVVGQALNDKIEAPVTFGVGYGVLIQHLPGIDIQNKRLKHECTEKGIRLISYGNVHNEIELDNKDASHNSDQKISIYPGSSKIIPLKLIKGNLDGNKFEFKCS